MIVLTFKEHSTPAKKVHSHPLPLVEPQQIPPVKSALVASVVFSKEVLVLLRRKAALVVEAHRIAAVLGLVHIVDVDPEEWIGQPP